METETFDVQEAQLPGEGRHILASFDADSIVVYQAYKPAIAEWAITHQRFGGPAFSFSRMSWIKPSFLWMMYRSGWAQKPDQSRVLSVQLRRAYFEQFVRDAVPAQFHEQGKFDSQGAWRDAVRASDVRIQWDPDRNPLGAPLARRAIQLGLRGSALQAYATQAILEITDITPFVQEQRGALEVGGAAAVMIPVQRVYRFSDA